MDDGKASVTPLLLIRLVHIHRVLVVIGAMEIDDDVDVVLRAVHMDGAVLGRRAPEFGDLRRAGIAQLVRVLIQGVPVQPMRNGFGVILRKYLFNKRVGIFFQIVNAGSLIAR